jgi:hypothetical protein
MSLIADVSSIVLSVCAVCSLLVAYVSLQIAREANLKSEDAERVAHKAITYVQSFAGAQIISGSGGHGGGGANGGIGCAGGAGGGIAFPGSQA